jgi:SNF2 family DNA or RNA helicase
VKYELSDYQITSRDFLASRAFAGLFDVPGVGKTPPTICAAADRVADTGLPALITAPAYLLDNWEIEIGRFAPGAKVIKANGSGFEARQNAFETEADFILTSYNNWSATWPKTLPKTKEQYDRFDIATPESWAKAQPVPHPLAGKRQYEILSTKKWAACVYDESHRLRGKDSQTTKHVWQLRRAKASNLQTPIWCLSGTPIVNNPGDLYPLLHLWRRKDYSSYRRFVEYYCYIIKTQWSEQVGQLRNGMEEEFQSLLGEFSLRRTLADVPQLASLEHRERDYVVDLPPSVRKTFTQARKEYIIEHPELDGTEFVNGGGALYSRLRQLATNPPTAEKPKIDFVLDFLQDRFGPVVVYVWYKDSARAVAEGLKKSKRPVTVVTGDVPTNKRTELVDKWKSAKDGILVATISSLKEGISLIHASDVVFLEHSPLPADQEQCVARLKRRGQQNLVNVHNVFAKGTPDTAIRRHLNERNLGLKRALISWLREED